MRILFLDDDDLRHEIFAEQAKAGGHESFHAHTVDEFAGLVDLHDFEQVWLDHDLNDFQYESKSADMYGSNEIDGRAAAHILNGLLPERRPKKIVIHSWNDTGAARMEAILRSGGFTDVHIEEFDGVAFFTRLKKWKDEGKDHKFLEFVVPEEKLKLLKWRDG
jgi:hypothetical protein